jgi:transcriptional regulator with XRE-family HTH domain
MGPYSHRIRAARQQKRLTQQQLADKLGVSRVSVTQWEIGTTKPSTDNLYRIADALDVDMSWLLTGDGALPNGMESTEGYSRQVLINVARELSENGVFASNDDHDTVVKAFLALCDEHKAKLSQNVDHIASLKAQPVD